MQVGATESRNLPPPRPRLCVPEGQSLLAQDKRSAVLGSAPPCPAPLGRRQTSLGAFHLKRERSLGNRPVNHLSLVGATFTALLPAD